MNKGTIEKRISKLETRFIRYGFEGITQDGEEIFFDAGKFLNLTFECMEKEVLEHRAPTMEDFSEEDRKYMKNFIRADLPKNSFVPMARRYFAVAESGNIAIKELPLESFRGPVDWETLRTI